MKIKEILSQHRRDFVAILECEHCGDTTRVNGYDDHNYHHNVIPAFKCPSCEKTAPDTYKPLEPKYHALEVV